MQTMLPLISVLMLLIGTVFCQNGAASVTPNYRVLSIAANQSAFLQLLPDGTYRGFIWDLMNTLKDMMGFNFTLELQADGQYGSMDSYGNWGGLTGQLISSKYDIVAGDYSISSGRESVTDFTTPYMCSHVVVMTQPNASLDNIKYSVYKGGLSAQLLQSSVDPEMQAIWANIQANAPTSLVTAASQGPALVRQGGWAYITIDSSVAAEVDSSYGQLVLSDKPLWSKYNALGVRLGDPLRKALNINLSKMTETGKMKQLLVKWGLGKYV